MAFELAEEFVEGPELGLGAGPEWPGPGAGMPPSIQRYTSRLVSAEGSPAGDGIVQNRAQRPARRRIFFAIWNWLRD